MIPGAFDLVQPALFENTALGLHLSDSRSYLYAEWLSVGDTTSLYAGLEAVAKFNQATRAVGLLTHMNESDVLSPNAMPSLLQEFLPKIVATGIEYFAVVLPPRIYSLATVQIVIDSIPAELEVKEFCDLYLAKAWLEEQLANVDA